ncbi:calcium-binding protein [uncultured Methylobacterium sp.]|jgi:Ca2+-binding RTX toxin-like protein|uniref:beta strand repeat-containing protein n=1 Tax=uncultured Methylobacterium sp. TaxID=157278 RepID=UPI0026212F45|nr:calcium-binding protein [uncultured Methylobacterium sp.]
MSTHFVVSAAARVNTITAGGQLDPAVATLSDGSYVVTWRSDGRNGSAAGFFAQRYDAAGAKLGGETRIAAANQGSGSAPVVAALKSGGYVATWAGPGQDGSSTDIYAQRYDAAGNPLGTQARVGPALSSETFQPAVTDLLDGGYVVTWTNDAADAVAQRYRQDGSAAGAPVLVSTNSAGYTPAVAKLATGGYAIVWQDGYLGSSLDLFARSYDAAGNPVGNQVNVNTTDVVVEGKPRIVGLSDGGYVVLWESQRDDFSSEFYTRDPSDVLAQRFDAQGRKVGGQTQITTVPGGEEYDPVVTALSGGGYVVVLRAASYTRETGRTYSLYAQRYDAQGLQDGTLVLLSDAAPYDYSGLDVSARPDGGYVVAWQDTGANYPGTPGSDIFTRTVTAASPAGTLTALADIVTGTAGDDVFTAPAGTVTARDHIDGRGGNDMIVLTAPGAADFSAVELIGIETIRGSAGNDTILVSGTTLNGVTLLDGGVGTDTLVATQDLDLRGTLVTGIERITVDRAQGATITVADRATLGLIDVTGTSGPVAVRTPGLTLTAEDRRTLFARGVDSVTDAGAIAISADPAVPAAGIETEVGGTIRNTLSTTLAALGDGGYVLVWKGGNSSGVVRLFAERYDANGNVVGARTEFGTSSLAGYTYPTATGLADGGYVVVWGSVDARNRTVVSTQRFDAAGTKVGPEGRLSGLGDNEQKPTVVGLPGGGYVVTWADASYQSRAQMFDAAGNPVGGEVLVAPNENEEQRSPAVAALADGGYAITLMAVNYEGSSPRLNVLIQRYDARGRSVGTETQVNVANVDYGTSPAIAGLKDGGYVVTWDQVGRDGGLYFQRYDAAGGAVGTATRVGSNNSQQGMPRSGVAALDDGGWVVTSRADALNVYVERYDRNGNRVGEAVQVNDSRGDNGEEFSSVVTLANGDYVVSWSHVLDPETGFPVGVFTRRFSGSDYAVLTPGADTVSGSAADSLLVTAPADLGPQDSLLGGDGTDTIELSASGRLNLTAPLALSGFERLLGASGDDTVVVSTRRLAGLDLIDGRGGTDTLTTRDASLDLSGLTLAGIEAVTSTNAAGTAYTVSSLDVALLVQGAGAADSLTASNLTFTQAQRETLFAHGIETVIDATGTTNGNRTIFGTLAADTLVGTAGDDRIEALAGDDRLDGRAGADTMLGGAGNDTYVVDDAGDVVTELAGQGRDTVLTGLSAYTLAGNVEALSYTGTSNFTGTGNDLANLITGGSRSDRLDGGAGADTLVGGLGNDTYVVDNVNDVVVEQAGEGIDRVLTSISYTLGDNVENLGMGTSASLSGTGNALANQLTGNKGNNVLDGRGGVDTLTGGAGRDTFVLRAGETMGDTVTDFVRGTDTLAFYGFGTDAVLSHDTGGDLYTVTSADGLTSGSFRLTGVTDLDLSAGAGNADARFLA